MSKRYLGLCLVFLSVVVAAAARAEDKKAPAMDEKAMMEAWMKYATPGPMHKAMDPMVGSWITHVTDMSMGAPQKSEGSAEFKWVLGGRYMEQMYSGSMMGQPFSGIGYTGWDNAAKKYLATWMDSAGTGMMLMEGNSDDGGKTVSMAGSMADPMSGKSIMMKGVQTMSDNDHMTYEMWGPGPDGKTMKLIEIHYERKK